jgi:hypothetical protein
VHTVYKPIIKITTDRWKKKINRSDQCIQIKKLIYVCNIKQKMQKSESLLFVSEATIGSKSKNCTKTLNIEIFIVHTLDFNKDIFD